MIDPQCIRDIHYLTNNPNPQYDAQGVPVIAGILPTFNILEKRTLNICKGWKTAATPIIISTRLYSYNCRDQNLNYLPDKDIYIHSVGLITENTGASSAGVGSFALSDPEGLVVSPISDRFIIDVGGTYNGTGLILDFILPQGWDICCNIITGLGGAADGRLTIIGNPLY